MGYDSLVDLAKPLMSMQTGISDGDHSQVAAAVDFTLREKHVSAHEQSPTKNLSSVSLMAPTAATPKKQSNESNVATPSTAVTEDVVEPSFAKPSTSGAAAVIRDPRAGRELQERNSYAINVWHR